MEINIRLKRIGQGFVFLLFIGLTADLYAQQTVRGTVTDGQSGETLPGVNILVKSTSSGTSTDSKGHYQLEVASLQDTLVFSFVGYQTRQVPIAGRTAIDVALQSQAISGEEMVVVGYGTQTKRDVTGSISSVSVEDIESKPVPSLEGALQGKASGVMVRQGGGALSGDFSVNIRGVGSVTGSDDPLYVVDGVPLFSKDFSTINKNDIESIDVLKDASATAIYGARAANGVVIITTKSGNAGKTQFTFNSKVGFEKITKTLDQLTTDQQAGLFVEAFKNSGLPTAAFEDPDAEFKKVDNDWQDLITRTALRQNYNMGVSGGNENTTYALSGSYETREGVLLNTDLNNYSLRANIEHDFNDRFKVTTHITGSHQNQDVAAAQRGTYFGGSGTLRQAIFTHSYAPYKDENGNFIGPPNGSAPYFGNNTNPVARRMEETRKRSTNRLLGNIKLDFDIIKNLTLSGSLGGDILDGNSYTYLPIFHRGINSRSVGNVSESNNREINGVANVTLTYENEITQKHSLKVLIGTSAQQFQEFNFSTNGTGTTNNQLDQLSNQTSFNSNGGEVTSGLISQFVRANYNYDDRYLLTGTLRRDGSSKFGPGNRYGYFPSGSIGWRISNEKFLKKSSFLSDLKLRVSYGLTGNQNIGNFAFLTRAGDASYVWGNQVVVGNASVNLGNPNLKWESSEQLDVGVDVGLFEGRVSFNADYYDRKSNDLLIQTPIPMTAGINQNPTVNIGSIENSGIEFSTTARILTGVFSWTTNFNVTYNKNRVLDIGTNAIGDPLQIPGQAVPLPNNVINLTMAGHPVGAFHMYQFDGIWQLDQKGEAAKYGSVPGDARYVDNNNNGELDEGDRAFVGNPNPKYFGGITNTFNYKGLSLTASINYAGGYQLFNGARNLFARAVPFVQNLAEVADYWTPKNPSNRIPRPSQGGTAAHTQFLSTIASTRFLENASYLRLQNVVLSYELPVSLLESLNISSTNASVVLTGTNLITITGYSGFDPEANTYGSLISAGQDLTPYPLSRIYTLGIKLNFQ